MEAPMTMTIGSAEPCLVRLPGEFGPILSCSGELSEALAAALEAELDLLAPLGHPAITVDLSGGAFTDLEGLLAVIEASLQIGEETDNLVLIVIAGTGRIARAIQATGLNRVLSVFPDSEAAALALRGGSLPGPGPGNWSTACAETVSYWENQHAALGDVSPEEALRMATASNSLCEHAEEVIQEKLLPTTWRCQSCPLFYALGGTPLDVGCRSLRDPLIEAIRRGDMTAARARAAGVLQILKEIPRPAPLTDWESL